MCQIVNWLITLCTFFCVLCNFFEHHFMHMLNSHYSSCAHFEYFLCQMIQWLNSLQNKGSNDTKMHVVLFKKNHLMSYIRNSNGLLFFKGLKITHFLNLKIIVSAFFQLFLNYPDFEIYIFFYRHFI